MKDANQFKQQLAVYKQLIDADIAVYSKHVAAVTRQQYGEYPGVVVDAYLDMLGRGGKRMRGALVMSGYELCGGTDQTMIVRAATALEMLHAYILIIDDIQDRSALRRGKPTVHEMLAAYHRKHHLQGDAAHAGLSLALNAATTGAHAAQQLLAGLQIAPELVVKVLGIVNYTMVITSQGQTQDIMNELSHAVSQTDVERAIELKTAHYSILNPLCVGMVLAGAGCEDTDAIRTYALALGRAFQITDDMLGTFGTEAEVGKSTLDDIREGKRTLLVVHALQHAPAADKQFLLQCLGNPKFAQADFVRCQHIIRRSGALEQSNGLAEHHIAEALASLQAEGQRWAPKPVAFLTQLAEHMLRRNS